MGFVVGKCMILVHFIVLRFEQPFVEENHPIHNFFLAKEYAIAIPAVVLVLGLVVIGVFIGTVMIKEAQKSKKK